MCGINFAVAQCLSEMRRHDEAESAARLSKAGVLYFLDARSQCHQGKVRPEAMRYR
jgi:hypothetical protein